MALFNAFDYLNRYNNGGKHTTAPLSVRFTTDGVGRRRVGETTSLCLCERILEKTYSWRGYPLQLAKQIANFYCNGNEQHRGYMRRSRVYTFDPVAGWTYTTTLSGRNQVNVVPMGGGMYSVDITLNEVDPFLVDTTLIPTKYDAWCGKMSTFYSHDWWCQYTGGIETPYLFERYYDEPLTVVGVE